MKTAPDASMDLFADPCNKARAAADAVVMARHLYLQGAWRTRKEISDALDWPDWRIRHAAEAAKGKIIFGQRGLRHILHATPEEFAACIAAMKSQVEAQQLRIINTEREYHSCGKEVAE